LPIQEKMIESKTDVEVREDGSPLQTGLLSPKRKRQQWDGEGEKSKKSRTTSLSEETHPALRQKRGWGYSVSNASSKFFWERKITHDVPGIKTETEEEGRKEKKPSASASP